MMRLYKNNIWRYVHIILGVAAVLAAFYLAILAGSMVNAETHSWVSGNIEFSFEDGYREKSLCVDKKYMVDGTFRDPWTQCYYENNGWEYAEFNIANTGLFGAEKGYAFRVGDEDMAYVTKGFPSGRMITSKVVNARGSDVIIILVNSELYIYRDVPSLLSKTIYESSWKKRTEYRMDTSSPDLHLSQSNNSNPLISRAIDVSNNGDWAVVQLGVIANHRQFADYGLARINLDTFSIRLVGPTPGNDLDGRRKF